MTTVLGAEGDGTLFDLLFSRPAGLLISLVYVAEASSTNLIPGHPGDLVSMAVNYGLPLTLVVYFIVRDDRRDKSKLREEAARRKEEREAALRREEQEKETAALLRKDEQHKASELQAETCLREERMTKRLGELEDYIHNSMMTGLTESSKAVMALATELRSFLAAIKEKEREK